MKDRWYDYMIFADILGRNWTFAPKTHIFLEYSLHEDDVYYLCDIFSGYCLHTSWRRWFWKTCFSEWFSEVGIFWLLYRFQFLSRNNSLTSLYLFILFLGLFWKLLTSQVPFADSHIFYFNILFVIGYLILCRYITYPMFIEPMITQLPLGFSGLWVQKLCFKKNL